MALPHPTLIRLWNARINGNAGFTQYAFVALSAQVKEDTSNDRQTICALMLDEMAIRKHVSLTMVIPFGGVPSTVAFATRQWCRMVMPERSRTY